MDNRRTLPRKGIKLDPALHFAVALLMLIKSVQIQIQAAPIQLAADFSSFAFTLLAAQRLEQAPQMSGDQAASNLFQVTNLVNNGGASEDDPEDSAADNLTVYVTPTPLTERPQLPGSNFSLLLKSDFHASQDDEDDLQSLNETLMSTTSGSTNSLATKDNHNQVGATATPATLTSKRPGLASGGHFIYLPNGQSVQFCDETKHELGCVDENAMCKLGACVCRPGFFQTRQSSLCQSIIDLLKNCENDLQCQAFNVDLVCDTKSHERPFCDCTPGLYFDQETHTCLPCHRNTFILTSASPAVGNETSKQNSNATFASNSTADSQPTFSTSSSATLRPCRPSDFAKMQRRKQQKLLDLTFPVPQYDDSGERLQMMLNGGQQSTGVSSSTSSFIVDAPTHPNHSSDPFRIKTPLEVFMGAIMLFTLFIVAWLFLQRIIHDCRTIIKSVRGGTAATILHPGDPNFTGTFTMTTTGAHMPSIGGEHHALELAMGQHLPSANSLAAARFAAALASASPDADYIETSPGFFARRRSATNGNSYMATTLAGAYHRSLAAGLLANGNSNSTTPATTNGVSASSTSNTLLATTVTNTGGQNSSSIHSTITRLLNDSDDDASNELVASIYPIIGHGSEANHGEYRHRDMTILRVALAAHSRFGGHHHPVATHHLPAGCMPINYLGAAFEPPPKYEEAIAQGAAPQLMTIHNPQEHFSHATTTTTSSTSPIMSRETTPTNTLHPAMAATTPPTEEVCQEDGARSNNSDIVGDDVEENANKDGN